MLKQPKRPRLERHQGHPRNLGGSTIWLQGDTAAVGLCRAKNPKTAFLRTARRLRSLAKEAEKMAKQFSY